MSQPRRAMPWEMTLQEFIGPHVVHLDGDLTAFRRNAFVI